MRSSKKARRDPDSGAFLSPVPVWIGETMTARCEPSTPSLFIATSPDGVIHKGIPIDAVYPGQSISGGTDREAQLTRTSQSGCSRVYQLSTPLKMKTRPMHGREYPLTIQDRRRKRNSRPPRGGCYSRQVKETWIPRRRCCLRWNPRWIWNWRRFGSHRRARDSFTDTGWGSSSMKRAPSSQAFSIGRGPNSRWVLPRFGFQRSGS